MRRKSRLSVYQEKRNRKTILFSIVGIIIVLFVLFKFGINSIVNFSLFLSGNKDSNSPASKNLLSFVSAPILDSMPSATNSAEIVIKGSADKDTNIDLYINGKQTDNIDTDSKGRFEFQENLPKGESLIQAKAKYKDKKSDFSNSYTISFTNSAPKLDLSSPTDGNSFHREDKSVNVQGQTDLGVTVTVNGFFAIIDESNKFSYTLQLHDGDNEIKIIAIDAAGNKSEKDIKVNYSQ